MTISVHLVIPCFRESNRLGPFLQAVCEVLGPLGEVSVLVVDDGSGAEEAGRTAELVEACRVKHPFVRPMLALPENVGKGGTVYAGWRANQGERWLMFADADGAVSAEEMARLIGLVRGTGQDGQHDQDDRAWFASRIKMLGREVERLFHRHLFGRVYATLVSESLRVPVYDTQCGCKVVPRRVYEAVADKLTLTGFSFDADLMMALLREGCAITEVPVDWREIPGGKIHLLRDSSRMFRDVYRLVQKWGRDGAVAGGGGAHP